MNHHKLNECTFKLSVPVAEIRGEPTRVCAVCRANEYSKAECWFCPEFLKILKKLLDKENEE